MNRARLVVCWLALVAVSAAGAATWKAARPGRAWSFPDDHHAMPGYRSEWWYLTGILTAAGRQTPTYGVQVTIFRIGLLPEPPPWDSDWAASDLVLGHLAVSDLTTGRHRFTETLVRAGPDRGGFPAPPDSVLAWVRAPAGTAGRWSLALAPGGFRSRPATVAPSWASRSPCGRTRRPSSRGRTATASRTP
ncbi:MAG: lipocalin-like domain-containing protein [Candidatus Krumholzibacteriia bacterium]